MTFGTKAAQPEPHAPSRMAWHTLPAGEVWPRLETSAEGLTSDEAAARRSRYGGNHLPHKPPPPVWLIFLRQFNSPLIYVLAAAAAVSVVVGEVRDAFFIGVVLVVNAAIGAWQEWQAERSNQSLQQLLRVRATVWRDGAVRETEAEDLVPGDVIVLESGNRVPADIRLLESNGFEVDESFLTGESQAVLKDPAWRGEAETAVGDRLNMGYAGAMVVRGRARGVVVDTGDRTEVGRLAVGMMESSEAKPPLILRMERFSRVIAYVMLSASVLVAGLGILLQGRSAQEMFFFAIALAVAAIPEGLPAALTVALSVASGRMARRGAIVRRLPAVEGLGSCTVIASDKTGTLTCNELTVCEVRLADGSVYRVSGEGFVPVGAVTRDDAVPGPASGSDRAVPALLASLVRAGILNNEGSLQVHPDTGAWNWQGDPTDIALLALARKVHGLENAEGDPVQVRARHPERAAVPFEAENRYSATWHGGFEDDASPGRVFVKGAPERVLSMCAAAGDDAAARRAEAEDMAARGLRVLALAEGDSDHDAARDGAPPEPGALRFLGFIGMIDPLRPGVREAVASCRDAGIQVWMVTGDHPLTALAIARDLGMADTVEQVVTGSALSEKTPEEFAATIGRARVFARVAPEQKLQLVQAAQAAGHFVAVTGDGVNDAPALRAANIGIAMGRSGTDVAREASSMTLSDDNFATIVAGVEEGRIAYQNVRNVVGFLISTSFAEILIALLAVSTGMPLPLLAVQILWLNLVTDGIQGVALVLEPGHGGELRQKPRSPSEPLFNRVMIERVMLSAAVMGGLGYLLFHKLVDAGWSEATARNLLLLYLVLCENIHILNFRSETGSAFGFSIRRSPYLLVGVLGALLLHVLFMVTPFGQVMLKVEPVDLKTFGLLLLLALPLLAVVEMHKWWVARREGAVPH